MDCTKKRLAGGRGANQSSAVTSNAGKVDYTARHVCKPCFRAPERPCAAFMAVVATLALQSPVWRSGGSHE